MGCCSIGKVVPSDDPVWDGKKWSWAKLKADWRTLKAGDILLISCREGARHKVVGALNSGYWDHVSLVIHGFDRSSWQFDSETENLTALDSANGRDTGPHMLESTREGVHIYNLWTRMTDVEANKYHRQTYSLRRLLGVERTPEFLKQVESFCRQVVGLPYSKLHELALSAFRANPTEDINELHCSELVSLFFKRLGLIPEDARSNNFHPGDFSSNGRKGKYQIDTLMQKKGSGAFLGTQQLIFYEDQDEGHKRKRSHSHDIKAQTSKGKKGKSRIDL